MAPRRKKNEQEDESPQKLTKEEDAIARYVRFNTPTEVTQMDENEVHYFTGSKAVDTLFESKYGAKAKGEPKFPDRKSAERFLDELLEKQLFFRARKLVAKKKEDKEKKKGTESDANKSPRPEPIKRKKDTKGSKVDETAEVAEEPKEEKKDDKEKKKKKKVKLEFHNSQVFVDSSDVYVWVFDPTPLYKKVIGLLMVVGTIVGCLFPLWPMWLRQGVYYLSLTGIGAFGAIIVTAILRTILFCVIWAATMGRHHLWILPNLTEDCGFFESFQPWYTYEYRADGKAPKQEKKKKKKDKNSEDVKEQPDKDDKQPENEGTNEDKEDDSAVEDVDDLKDDLAGTGSSQSSEVEHSPKPSAAATGVRKRPRKDDFVVLN